MLGSSSSQPDVIVAGAGPAGLSIAAEIARRGLRTRVVAPAPRGLWNNSFGTFASSLRNSDLISAAVGRFPHPQAWSAEGEFQVLPAEYVRFDSGKLQQLLMERALSAGVELIDGRVSRGESSEGQLLIDATGVGALRDESSQPDCYQSAYGRWIETESSPYASGEMALMDYRPVSADGPVSFLYAMSEGSSGRGERLFVQETVLASEEPVSFELLQKRLETRLSQMGIESTRVLDEEKCLIPMGVDLPLSVDAVLPFGASAGFVHPATGYQLARSLTLAPGVAEAVAATWNQGRAAAATAGLEAMWPSTQRRAWQLYRWGAAVLTGMSPAEMRDFVRAFFSLPRSEWMGFMEGTLEPKEILNLMWKVFRRAPSSLRWRLAAGSSLHGGHALRSVLATA